MRTQDFIAREAQSLGDNYGRNVKCSNVFRANDRLYSYGYHYPLLFPIGNNRRLLVVNAQGYSVSTSRHISYARPHADITVYSSDVTSPENIRIHLEVRLSDKKRELDGLTRRGTQREQRLRDDISAIEIDLVKLAALGY
jgi:hypothetical protein